SVFQADPAESLQKFFIRSDGVLFAVHPERWASAKVERLDNLRALPRGEAIRVAPTASTRTVLALEHAGDIPPHFIKLHYPRRISRFNRRLKRMNIHNSVAVSRDVAHVEYEKFAYLPEVRGVVLGDGDVSGGCLV